MKLVLISLFLIPFAATTYAAPPADKVAPDNTKKNERDRDPDAKTPGDQGENKADLAITQSIRQQVVKQKLSMLAKNVKIITADAVVTLRGPVKTEEEKTTIGKIAEGVSGVKHVDNQLEIAAK